MACNDNADDDVWVMILVYDDDDYVVWRKWCMIVKMMGLCNEHDDGQVWW